MGLPTIADLITRAIVLVIAFTAHEYAHAWTADRLGDPLPRREGRLTLDPRQHVEPLGWLMALIAGFGWARPVRWTGNPFYLKVDLRWAGLLIAAAGPLSNLALAAIGGLPVSLGLVSTYQYSQFLPTAGQLVTTFVWFNVMLFVFNMLPIMPLDGYAVAVNLLPPRYAIYVRRLEPYGMAILMALIFIPYMLRVDVLGAIIGPPIEGLTRLFLGI
ncbi:MAG TPA: site-2 protease family protein [Anaerolineae bacterium]|nr:site-2 protease family protein [Anaerolineae bacterium]